MAEDSTEHLGSSDCSSVSKFPQFTCNPVFRGMFELGDPKNTKVEFSGAGEVVHIIQGNQLIEVSIGFFRDVCIVFDRAMKACENEDQASAMLFHGLGSSRSYPTADWD
jgi:hypothetical protein